MGNRKELVSSLQELREDNIRKQKEDCILLLLLFSFGQQSQVSIYPHCRFCQKLIHLLLFNTISSVGFLLSKILKIDFQNKENPLSGLGLLISLNQMLYILIAMWVYAVMPEKMLMVYAIIFGAHLLPYGWLYQSKTYYVFSILIPIIVLLLGIYAPTFFVAVFMLITEIIFCSLLILENKKVKCYETN